MASRELLLGLSKEILRDYAPDWKIKIGTDSECITDLKIIYIGERWLEEPICYCYEILIHEIAHIKEKPKVETHNSCFYNRLGKLMIKYSYMIEKYKQLDSVKDSQNTSNKNQHVKSEGTKDSLTKA